ncbi:MAG: internal scaffolding protein [Microvirus sp.]|nr:MAG: internal scaffolding protein [Microvirus sp.]
MKTTILKADRKKIVRSADDQAAVDARWGVNRHQNRPEDPRRRRTQHIPQGKSMTQQQFVDECDVNKIVERHAQNGTLAEFLAHGQDTATRAAQMGPQDFTQQMDFQEAMNVVTKANEMFADLPAKTRERFNNNPGEFLRFMEDKDNADEALKLGILEKVQQPVDPNLDLKANTEALKEHNAALKSRKGPKTDDQ